MILFCYEIPEYWIKSMLLNNNITFIFYPKELYNMRGFNKTHYTKILEYE